MTTYYGNLAEGDSYFSRRLKSEDWEEASDSDKEKALYQATSIIDRLSFRGTKTSSSQENQFPRGGDTTVPTDIRYATYEVALTLLSGYSLDTQDTNVKRRKFTTSIETEWFDVPGHIGQYAGIISKSAWSYLYPYLYDVTSVTLQRVS